MNIFQLLFLGAEYWYVAIGAALLCMAGLYVGGYSLWWSTPVFLYVFVCVAIRVLYTGPQ